MNQAIWLQSHIVTKLYFPLNDRGLNTRPKFKQEIFPLHESQVSLTSPAECKSLMFSGCKVRCYMAWHWVVFNRWSETTFQFLFIDPLWVCIYNLYILLSPSTIIVSIFSLSKNVFYVYRTSCSNYLLQLCIMNQPLPCLRII